MSLKHEEKELYANAIDDTLSLTGSATVAEDRSVEESIGVVTDCQKLNIRKEPNRDSEVIAVVSSLDELRIDSVTSTDDWYAVCTVSGIEGFCMKKFVAVAK